MVQVTVIDANGRRYPVRGLEGQSLVEILLADEGPLDVSNLVCLSPAGGGTTECIALIPQEYTQKIPPPDEDHFRTLERLSEKKIVPNMRLGSKIVLSKELNNMLVSLGPLWPWRTL